MTEWRPVARDEKLHLLTSFPPRQRETLEALMSAAFLSQ